MELTDGEVCCIMEILDICLEYMERSYVDDAILNKIESAIAILDMKPK